MCPREVAAQASDPLPVLSPHLGSGTTWLVDRDKASPDVSSPKLIGVPALSPQSGLFGHFYGFAYPHRQNVPS